MRSPFQRPSILLAPALLTLAAGCATPPHSTGLHQVLGHELNEPARIAVPDYRCTMGAHRGSSVEHRENTLAALKAAEEDDRFAFVEFDVQFTRDEQIVVFHDQRLTRLFGKWRSVGGSTYEDLVRLTDGDIATYAEAMTALEKVLNIEIKSQGDADEDARLADAVIADLQRRGRLRDVVISSISADAIAYISRVYPSVKTGKIVWLTSSTYMHLESLTRGLYEEARAIGADYLMLHTANLRNIETLLALKPRDVTLVFWDFDDRMYLVHKDGGDRLWSDGWWTELGQRWRYYFRR